MSVRNGVTVRGTTNGNARGSSYSRRRRREWLVETYRANVDLVLPKPGDAWLSPLSVRRDRPDLWPDAVPACRCYRCGVLLTVDTVTVDRIIPGYQGGTYRRDNIRPACGPCNSKTGGGVRA